MNKKNTLKKTAALMLGMALAVGGAGCGFVVTDSEKDYKQTIATVDITGSLAADADYKANAADVGKVIKLLNNDKSYTEISKRDLVSYFLSTGYTYVQNYGYSYEDTFNMLLDGLVSREIMIQYAVAYYLANGATVDGCHAYIEAELAKAQGKEKELLEAHREVLAYKYFLTANGTDTEDYDQAVYSLKLSLNSSLDSLEAEYIAAESETHEHGDVRTTPTGVGTAKDEYYTNDYEIYTGRNTPDSCGEYERLDGSTASTRKKAYNNFLANLEGYGLIKTSGKDAEDTGDVTKLDYYYVELASSLGQALVSQYYEKLEDKIVGQLDATYVGNKYQSMYEQQEQAYKDDPTSFETAVDGMSDSSFVLYGLNGNADPAKKYGFVYNILLPFSAEQSAKITSSQSDGLSTVQEYNVRRAFLSQIEATDQRESWFCEHEDENYAYKRADGKYYFFEDHMTDSTKYEKLSLYAGNYPYNGTVTKNGDGEYEFDATPVKINDFIDIFNGYINETVEREVASGAYNTAVYDNPGDYKGTDGKIDYGKFVYYKGKVNVDWNAADHFTETTDAYKALSAVNELMFAYSTDTGCLNTYLGYAVSPYGTDFVKEFEYAAQKAVEGGVGTYYVCATDYGWHIIYCSFVFDGEKVYGVYDHDQAVGENKVEGSFSNLFYESLKETAISNYTSEVQSTVLNQYNNDTSVKRYESRYKDLLKLDS